MIYLLPWKKVDSLPWYERRTIDNKWAASLRKFGSYSIRWDVWHKYSNDLRGNETILAFNLEHAKKRFDKRLLATGKFEFVDEERAEKLRLLL